MRFLADLALFVEVASAGNFSRAAVSLGMPLSTLSRRINALERELGVSLIHRSTRIFRLTQAGQACYEQSKSLVSEARRIQEDVTGVASRAAGHIRIGVPFDLAQTLFVPLIARYMEQHSDTTVEVSSIIGHPNILADGLDLGIMVGHQLRLPDSTFWSRRVGSFPRRLFASENYLNSHQNPEEPEDLVQHACNRLLHGEPLSTWELRRGREHRTVTVDGRATANSVGMLAKFAKENAGIVLLPDFLATHPAFGGGLVRVLPDWEAVPAHIFAVAPTAMLPSRVRKLVTSMKEGFEQALEAANEIGH